MPVVERSVTIAGISTRELVLKDYVTEQSEDKLRQAGRLMAQKLAGSLALVTCKEPLKSNLASHIRTFISEFGFTEVCFSHSSQARCVYSDFEPSQQTLSDQVVALIVSDNLEIACQAIENAAMQKADIEVDESFVNSYEARRRHREVRLSS